MFNKILILDFGSQYTQLIARRVREFNVFSEVIPCTTKFDSKLLDNVKGIILSGGPASVDDSDAPAFSEQWLDCGLPILGICYGMQLIARHFGGELGRGKTREYGPAVLKVLEADGVFAKFSKNAETKVWMSHGDHVKTCPSGFTVTACSTALEIAAISAVERKIFALQFHPEVVHSERGKEMLSSFVFEIADAKADWTPEDFIESSIEKIRSELPETGHVICALSGGVDSTVAAVLVNRAIGDRLHCIFVDNGLLRLNEGEQVPIKLSSLGLNIKRVDAEDLFLGKLAGVSDPEKKRKIIGNLFIEIFEEEANKLESVTHLIQGTLYPDVIESVSVKGPSAVIKSHHNVGGLPERMKLKLLEPLRELFKDEVRKIGRSLGIPEELVSRQPFPGPGLAVRCLGDICKSDLSLLKQADDILQSEIRAAGLYTNLWQSFCVLLPVRSVGVMGDNRTYEKAVAIRAVKSEDGMTADWVYLPEELLRTVSNKIINKVRGINRVVMDISSKPPATIEWE